MATKKSKTTAAKKASTSSPKTRVAAKSSKLSGGTKSASKKAAAKPITPKSTTAKPEEPKTTTQATPINNASVANAPAPNPPQEQRLTKTYLTPEELKHFEQILLQKRAEVLRDLEIMRNAYSEDSNNEESNSSYSMHMADHGTETMDKEQHFMFIARDERYLSYIDKALERIKNGTYGICAVSGLPIPKERLEAVPHTAVRIEYKNRGK